MKLEIIPEALNRLKNPPKELNFIGDTSLLSMPKVAVVGSRKASVYTKECVTALCAALKSANVCVVSGGAIGVDITAHKAAMPRTIGVFANGLDIIYPAQNKAAIREIYEKASLDSFLKDEAGYNKHGGELAGNAVPAIALGGKGVKLVKDRFYLGKNLKNDKPTIELVKDKDSATNVALHEKYKKELSNLEISSLFNKDGTLTKEAILKREQIIAGDNLGNIELIKELTKDGSNIKDWAKFKIDANKAEIHFYYNEKNNRAYYDMDYKTKFKVGKK